MIRPTPRALVAAGAGFPLAAVPILLGAGYWPLWASYVVALVFLIGADAVLCLPARALAIETTLPKSVRIGEGGALRVWLGLPDRGPRVVEAMADLDPDLVPQPPATVRAARGGNVSLEVRLEPRRRGTVSVRALWLRWNGPMGLVRREHRHALDGEVAVVTDLRPPRIAALRLAGQRDARSGLKVEHYPGDGSEFDALREFVPGFDRRAVDWKASARHKKLLCREYRAERNHQVILAMDTGHLMAEPLQGVPRLDHAIAAALSLAWVALKTGDLVGLYAFDDRPRLYRRPEGGLKSLSGLQHAAAGLGYSTAETAFTLGITDLLARVRRRSLVVLFTDFVDSVTAELITANLDRFARRHLVLFVALRDPGLDRIAAAPPRSLGTLHRAVVATDLIREREVVLARLRRSGVQVIDALAREVSADLVNRYLDLKRRESV